MKECFLHSEYWSAGFFYNGQSPWRARIPGDRRWTPSGKRPASEKDHNTGETNKQTETYQTCWKQSSMMGILWHSQTGLMSPLSHTSANRTVKSATHRLHTLKFLPLLDLLQFAHIVQWLVLKVLSHVFHLYVCLWRRAHTRMITAPDMEAHIMLCGCEAFFSGWWDYKGFWDFKVSCRSTKGWQKTNRANFHACTTQCSYP